ncbi:MAG: site-specific integrase [Bacteroidales bacterium]|nr:site-specific integrase [Bacteroidales bacterium]
MRTNNTFGVQFIVRTNKAKIGLLPVYARISVDSRRVELSLKQFISPDNWNAAKGAAKGKSKEIRDLNTYLEQIRSRITECYQQLVLKKRPVTAEAVKNLFCGFGEKEHSLLSIFEYHNAEMKTTLEWGTQKNYFTTKRYIEEFLKSKHKTSDVYLSELNYKFLVDFEQFMKAYVPKDHQRPCGQNTVMKHIERLRKVINMAIKNDWLERDPFQKFKPVFMKNERQFLSIDELLVIEQKEFRITRLQQVKDLFVFSCYTGLAYIDVFNLTPQNIMRGIDGDYWLSTSRTKTDIPVHIPLLPQPLAIIEKYKDNPRIVANGKLLPVCSNQKLNSYLKEIADLCGIEKPLTFHIARHTFATTVTLTNGVPIETVSKLLGHTSIKTTQIYAKVIEQKVKEDMQNLRDKLEGTSLQTKRINAH